MKKTLIFLCMVLVIGLVFAGCAEKNDNQGVSPVTENITREQEATEEIPETEETKEAETVEEKEDTQIVEEKEETVEETEQTNETSEINLFDICSEIKTSVSASGAMDLDADAIANLYGISPEDIEQAAGFVVMEGTFPHEVVVVEAKNEDATDRIEELLKTKHAAFTEQSKGYDAANYELASKCKVERKGYHVSMFLTPDFEAMRSVYSKYVK